MLYDKLNLFIDWNNGKDFAGNQVGEAITQNVTYYVDDVVMGFGRPVYYQGGSNQTEQESSSPADWTLKELTLTFDANDNSGYALTDFGGNASSVVTGNDAPANSDGSVVKVLKTAGAQTWAGTTFLDVSGDGELISDGNTVVTADVFSAKDDATVLLKLEDGSNSSNFIELGVSTESNGSEAWESLSWDLSTVSGLDHSNNYDKVSIFFDFGNAGGGEVYYLDNVDFSGYIA